MMNLSVRGSSACSSVSVDDLLGARLDAGDGVRYGVGVAEGVWCALFGIEERGDGVTCREDVCEGVGGGGVVILLGVDCWLVSVMAP